MSRPTENNSTDRYLVEQVLSGDSHAFGEIVKKTEGLVAQMVFKMISNPDDRKDIVQDIYLKAFRGLGSFKFQAKLSTWIGQITYNTCLNHLEKKKLVLWEQTEQDYEETIDDSISRLQPKADKVMNETEQSLLGKELKGILNTEIEKLSPLYKTLITLYHQEELSYGEIAQITSLPEGTVKSYLFRARKALKENILSGYKREEL
jgi:RNA polymerase sigma factor (sigma-70 family)